MKTVCIEGWRGVNHSIAMVNQHQLLALLGHAELQLYHRDLPYFMKHWDAKRLPAGFSAGDAARIAALPAPPQDGQVDCIYRIVSPFLTGFAAAQRTLSFMVTECALVDACFDRPVTDHGAFTREGNLIVTPSAWSRERLVEGGFDGERTVVVPHGVDGNTFRPLPAAERAANRRAMGLADDELVFLNVGVATWNKGLDLLVEAFAHVKKRLPTARLMIKENKALYGLTVDRTVAEVRRDRPGLIDDAVLASIAVISSALDQAQLCALYNMADVYVSPYRAEGFNLPALEAMACGTPVLVTDGGPTDDFCPPLLAAKVASRRGLRADAPQDVGPFLVPDVESLVAGMVAQAEAARASADAGQTLAREQARRALVARLSWPAVADRLAALF